MRPVVILPSCRNSVFDETGQTVLDSYLDAVSCGAGVLPLVIPCPQACESGDMERILGLADGILLTGSPSNIEPRHYGGPIFPGTLHDPARDALTLQLARVAVARGIPLLGICRGLQEINVALGGSLHQRVHESGFTDHREPSGPPDRQYGEAHVVEVVAGGRLFDIVGQPQLIVNSLHWQGINGLPPGCRIEARAGDGLVEAISFGEPGSFGLAVQWHPEWRWRENPASVALFAAFGAATRKHAAERTNPNRP